MFEIDRGSRNCTHYTISIADDHYKLGSSKTNHSSANKRYTQAAVKISIFHRLYLPREADRIISGYFGLVAICVTQPLCPLRVPRSCIVSVMLSVLICERTQPTRTESWMKKKWCSDERRKTEAVPWQRTCHIYVPFLVHATCITNNGNLANAFHMEIFI